MRSRCSVRLVRGGTTRRGRFRSEPAPPRAGPRYRRPVGSSARGSEVVRFRTKRRFLTTPALGAWLLLCAGAGVLAMVASPWAGAALPVAAMAGRAVFVVAVPPRGGRRVYEVTPAELVVHAGGERLAIPWRDVEYVVHRPVAKTHDGGTVTTHWEHIELFLTSRRVSRITGLGRRRVFGRGHRDDRRILIHGVHRQGALSKLVIERCRDRIVRRLRTALDRGREVEYGDFRLDGEGVRAPAGFLPWRTAWRIRHHHTAEGTNLVLTTPDGQVLGGWVPERTTAEELLRARADA